LIGNVTVLWIVLGKKRMQSPTNSFLVNISIADIGMAVLNCLPSFIFMRDNVWILGSFFCSVSHFSSYLTISVSVFTLLALTKERYKVIMTPLTPRTKKTKMFRIIILIWIISVLISLPPALFALHVPLLNINMLNETSYLCIVQWPDGSQGDSFVDYSYNCVFFLLTYLIPGVIMIVSYSKMCSKLWRDKIVGNYSDALAKAREDKKNVVKMFIIIVTMFGICWLPYNIYFLYIYHDPDTAYLPYIKNVYLSLYWLAMANSCVNPFIYYFMNSRFQKQFNQVFKKIWLLSRYIKIKKIESERPKRGETRIVIKVNGKTFDRSIQRVLESQL